MESKLLLDYVRDYVKKNIPLFHSQRLDSIKNLKVEKLLKNKNPYLGSVKNLNIAGELITFLTNSHLASQEETMFGAWLEDLARFIAGLEHAAIKSNRRGIDIEWNKYKTATLLQVKSGPNWGNSSQKADLVLNFANATKELTNSYSIIDCVEGICYGMKNQHKTKKAQHRVLYGQDFWTFISNAAEFYTEIIEPLSFEARERNEEFDMERAKCLNIMTKDFSEIFVIDGRINWKKVVQFTSAKQELVFKRVKDE